MSNIDNPTTTTNADATADKPKRTRKPKSSKIEHSVAIAQFSKAHDIDDVTGGKQFRSRLRANIALYVKNGGTPHVKNTPWGPHARKALVAVFPEVKSFKG